MTYKLIYLTILDHVRALSSNAFDSSEVLGLPSPHCKEINVAPHTATSTSKNRTTEQTTITTVQLFEDAQGDNITSNHVETTAVTIIINRTKHRQSQLHFSIMSVHETLAK